jgi:hypothetical protein
MEWIAAPPRDFRIRNNLRPFRTELQCFLRKVHKRARQFHPHSVFPHIFPVDTNPPWQVQWDICAADTVVVVVVVVVVIGNTFR